MLTKHELRAEAPPWEPGGSTPPASITETDLSKGITSAIDSCNKSNYSSVNKILRICIDDLERLGGANIASAFHCIASIVRHRDCKRPRLEDEDRALFDSILVPAAAEKAKANAFNPQELSNILWALSALRMNDIPLVSELVAKVVINLPRFWQHDLSQSYLALAQMGFKDVKLLGPLIAEMLTKAERFNPRDIAFTMQGIAVRNSKELLIGAERALLATLAEVALTKISHATESGIIEKANRALDALGYNSGASLKGKGPLVTRLEAVVAHLESRRPARVEPVAVKVSPVAAPFHSHHVSYLNALISEAGKAGRGAISAILGLCRDNKEALDKTSTVNVLQRIELAIKGGRELSEDESALLNTIMVPAVLRHTAYFNGAEIALTYSALVRAGVKNEAVYGQIMLKVSESYPSIAPVDLASIIETMSIEGRNNDVLLPQIAASLLREPGAERGRIDYLKPEARQRLSRCLRNFGYDDSTLGPLGELLRMIPSDSSKGVSRGGFGGVRGGGRSHRAATAGAGEPSLGTRPS